MRVYPGGRGVRSGVLSVNSHSSVRYTTPFGGFKQSGVGRELGPEGMHHYMEDKSIYLPAGFDAEAAVRGRA